MLSLTTHAAAGQAVIKRYTDKAGFKPHYALFGKNVSIHITFWHQSTQTYPKFVPENIMQHQVHF